MASVEGPPLNMGCHASPMSSLVIMTDMWLRKNMTQLLQMKTHNCRGKQRGERVPRVGPCLLAYCHGNEFGMCVHILYAFCVWRGADDPPDFFSRVEEGVAR